MRDRLAVRHAASPGGTDDGRRHHVAVVGGGIAGLAAATALAERNVAVTLYESEAQLGGRVRAWPIDGDPDGRTMSRGFHAFFRQYYNLRALLRRTDPELARLRAIPDYPLLSPEHRDSFTRIPRTPPFNLLTFVLRSKTFTLRDLTKVDTAAAGELLDVQFPGTFSQHDGESASDFLDRLRFPQAARHLALEVFARSFFADPSDFSAGELIAMFHAYFLGSAEGLLFDVPDDDYDTALWAPLGAYLEGLGVSVRTSSPVTSLDELDADAVVVAPGLGPTQRLLDGAIDDAEWSARLAALRPAPSFAVWRVWLDRRANSDRPPFLATAGFDIVDNISVVNGFEAGAARWAREHSGSVIEVHAYALPDGIEAGEVKARMRKVLDEQYPELAGARIEAEQYLLEADCPLVGTEPWALRPDVTTPDPRIVLAGDMVRCDYPVALMERAATTGFQAANRLLAGWDLAGHDLWTVPMAARNWFARHAGKAAVRQARSHASSPERAL